MKSAAFLGDRPERFTFGDRKTDPLCRRIKSALVEQAMDLYGSGVRRFYCSLSPGIGFWAAEAVLTLRATPAFPEATLVGVMPFEGCDRHWAKSDQSRYHRLLSACNEIRFACHFAPNAKNPAALSTSYKRRDYLLVDEADQLVVVYDQDRSVRTQVGQAVNYAKSKGRDIRYIHPDTAQVT